MDSFYLIPLCVLLSVQCVTAPLGSFVLWYRLSFFTDALSHACLLGISLSLLFKFSPYIGLVLVGFLLICLLFKFRYIKTIPQETLLAIFSYGFLSLALVLLFLNHQSQAISPEDLLFGDILTATINDFLFNVTLAISIIIFMAFFYRKLVLYALSKDIALIHYPKISYIYLGFLSFLTLAVAINLLSVGSLLFPALMILPAASARLLSKTPIQMLFASVIIGGLSSIIGYQFSFYYDIPTSPTIVLVLAIILIALTLIRSMTRIFLYQK
jgi:zinc transport system permease protein